MRNSLLLAAAVAVVGCTKEEAPKPPPTEAPKTAAPPARSGKVTLLITGHEVGQLVAKAPRLMTQWKQEDGWPNTLAFSTGDTFSGAALSSRFDGKSTAEAMKAMQYKASAFGNHDLDLGPEVFSAFRKASGLEFLAANLRDKENADQPLELAPTKIFTRDNVKVGVIGFTSQKTITTVVAGRAAGLELVHLKDAFPAALEQLQAGKPDVTVALIDDCFTALQPFADGKVDLVVGTRCEGDQELAGTKTQYFSVGDELTHYVSAQFSLTGDGTRALVARRKDVSTTVEEDADLAAVRTRWQKELDAQLGEVVGFTKTGYPVDAPQLRTLVATALRDSTQADAALINKKGIRAPLAAGNITRESIYTLMPFENAVLTAKVKGEVLQKLKSHPEAFVLAPAKLEPEKEYVLATTEYIYFGGDGLGLEVVAPEPELNGMVWQTPVIEWVRKQNTTEKAPLEKLIKK
ncbi:MAG: bifunctional metallophosphatase/5'-nucleotidase [Archangium sp.]